MAEKRATRRARQELGGSWVDADASYSEEEVAYTPSPDRNTSRKSPRSATSHDANNESTPRRRAPHTSRSPEPELIMPSINHDYDQPVPRPPRRAKARPTPAEAIEEPTMLSSILSFVLDVAFRTLHVLKTPIAYFLAAWLFIGFLTIGKNMLVGSIHNALSPLCSIPGASYLGLTFCDVAGNVRGGAANVKFEEAISIQSRFEDILEKTAKGVGLPADMKHSEAYMRDLRSVVRMSHVRSRHELELELSGFIQMAEKAAWDLQRFDSRTAGAVDVLLSTTKFTQRQLEDIDAEKRNSNSMIGFVGNTFLSPFYPVKTTETELVATYLKHMDVMERQIGRLLDDATALRDVLRNCEARLETIHEIGLRDDSLANLQRDEVLGSLWTMLGGNRRKLGQLDSQLKILSKVGQYRKNAFEQITGTITELQKMDLDLQELREKVGEAEFMEHVPIHVHLMSIELGARRLEDKRTDYKQVHEDHVRGLLDRTNPLDDSLPEEVPEIEGPRGR